MINGYVLITPRDKQSANAVGIIVKDEDKIIESGTVAFADDIHLVGKTAHFKQYATNDVTIDGTKYLVVDNDAIVMYE
jgi:co-chaperonin GroES (HSP10)